MIKSFRGLLTDPEQRKINIHTNNGAIGYKIIKFQVMPNDIDGSTAHEASVQVWKTFQTTLSVDVDFEDQRLLAAAYYIRTTTGGGTPTAVFDNQTVVFDNQIFNQDIFVVYKDGQGGQAMNYYMELEQIKLDVNENTVATLKDIRNTTQ